MSENLTLVTRRASEILIRPHQRDNHDSHRPPVPVRTATQRQSWTIAEWTEFVQRSRDVQERLGQALKAIERIPGFSVKTQDRICKAISRISWGLDALEDIVALDCWVDPMPIIHGPKGHDIAPSPESRFAHLPEKPLGPRTKRRGVISLEAWTIEGRYIMALRADLCALAVDLGEHFQKTRIKRARGHFVRADRDFAVAMAAFASLLAKHHPEVPNPTAFFNPVDRGFHPCKTALFAATALAPSS